MITPNIVTPRRVFFGAQTPYVQTLLAICFVCLVFQLTHAQVMTPNLEGETFQSPDRRSSTVACSFNIGKGGQITFSVTGLAVGPHPGTFLETGKITFDSLGVVTSAEISFSIKAPIGFITGKKTASDGRAFCTLDERTGTTTLGASIPTLNYTADVAGSPDSGTATLDLFASIDPRDGLTTLQFTEIFHSSNVERSTPGKVTGGGNIVPLDRNTGMTFGFNAQNTDNGMKGAGTVIDHIAGVKVKILEVQTFVISGTHATFTGTAEVNGVEEKFRIDVDDLGEPGGGLDSFRIVTDSYGGGGTLSGGNIQIHK